MHSTMFKIGDKMNLNNNVKVAFQKLGAHVKFLRTERNISLEELSKYTNIRKEYLKKIEDGNAYGVMIERHLIKIAKAFGIQLCELVDYE